MGNTIFPMKETAACGSGQPDLVVGDPVRSGELKLDDR